MRRTLLFVLALALLVQPGWTIRLPMFAAQDARAMQCESTGVIFCAPMVTTGAWSAHGYDLVFTVAFSRKQQPNGPLVVYRASGTDLRTVVPVVALQRGPLPLTSLFFPSPEGQYLALLRPGSSGYGTYLQGGTLGLLATDGSSLAPRLLVPYGVAAGDQVIWSANSSAVYYHSGVQQYAPGVRKGWVPTRGTQLASIQYHRL